MSKVQTMFLFLVVTFTPAAALHIRTGYNMSTHKFVNAAHDDESWEDFQAAKAKGYEMSWDDFQAAKAERKKMMFKDLMKNHKHAWITKGWRSCGDSSGPKYGEYCGRYGNGCWCDRLCFYFGDCCPNFCMHCADRVKQVYGYKGEYHDAKSCCNEGRGRHGRRFTEGCDTLEPTHKKCVDLEEPPTEITCGKSYDFVSPVGYTDEDGKAVGSCGWKAQLTTETKLRVTLLTCGSHARFGVDTEISGAICTTEEDEDEELTNKCYDFYYDQKILFPAPVHHSDEICTEVVLPGVHDITVTGIPVDDKYDPAGHKATLAVLCESGLGGDPHATNLAGHKFEILQVGTFPLVEITAARFASVSPYLAVSAGINHVESDCGPTYIQNVSLSGKWLFELAGTSGVQVRVVHWVPKAEALQVRINDQEHEWHPVSRAKEALSVVSKATDSQVNFKVHEVTVHVSLGRNERKVDKAQGYNFLNVNFRGLDITKKDMKLSGLIVSDDVSAVSQAPTKCQAAGFSKGAGQADTTFLSYITLGKPVDQVHDAEEWDLLD